MKKMPLIAILVLLSLLVTACGSSATTTGSGNTPTAAPSPTASGPLTITMGATTFSTTSVTILSGSTITFVDDKNTGSMHILVIGMNGTAQSESGAPDFGASGQTFNPGDSWTTPAWNTEGVFHVTCEIHPATMNLTVNVTGY